jgi:hypothetical protein
VLGALLVAVFLNGTDPISGAPHLPHSLPGWDPRQFLLLLGLALIVAAFVLAALSTAAKNRAAAARSASWDDWRVATGMTGMTGVQGASGDWDDGGDGWEEGGTDFGASNVYDSPEEDNPRQSSSRRRPPPRW